MLDEELNAGVDPLGSQLVVGNVGVQEYRVFANGTRSAGEHHIESRGLPTAGGPDAQPELLVLCGGRDRSLQNIVIGGLRVRFVGEDRAAGFDAVAADVDRRLGFCVLGLERKGEDDVGIAFTEHEIILAGGEKSRCGGVVTDEGRIEGGTTNGHVKQEVRVLNLRDERVERGC